VLNHNWFLSAAKLNLHHCFACALTQLLQRHKKTSWCVVGMHGWSLQFVVVS